MNALTFNGESLVLRPSGALWWPTERLLCVSDLHLGKAERMARRGGALVPPYECDETLERLDAEISAMAPRRVICLGDSFDDGPAEHGLSEAHRMWIARMMAGRDWVWIAGNHDPGPVRLGGEHLAEVRLGGLVFRHIAEADAAPGEVSGHYHPKARLAGSRRPCFLTDGCRLILPAFGSYTGGMDADAPEILALLRPPMKAVLTGPTPVVFPIGP
ncbi:putative phosphoesterase [Aliiruegeria haliotis]|uniref:Putative phosphoesterase n=1 Tax=Aliiruegeria haliotis TaxID=1280846 RepID=A0A2T0RVE3_9RHOB|nr:ligase-associated DNA damage response endonuclease PdeM [Aliiruegeria haliotis]PRY25118.1 putative phosphoesterase [Aliiruegeria haliotis]